MKQNVEEKKALEEQLFNENTAEKAADKRCKTKKKDDDDAKMIEK